MLKNRDLLVPVTFSSAILAVLLIASPAAQAQVTPQVQQPKASPIERPTIDPARLVAADVSVDWILLNKAIREGDPVGASVLNVSIKNSDAVNVPTFKVSLSVAALGGGPAPAELSGTRDCPVLARAASYAFTWPNPSSSIWKAGSYRLIVEADNGKLINDSNRQNNVKTFDFTVLPSQIVKVTDGAGSPLAASVSALSGGAPVAGSAVDTGGRAVQVHTTNAQGMAYFPGLTPGRYQFLATADGYDAKSVTASAPGALMTITLPKRTAAPKGSALIAVMDINGSPVSGATVSVTTGGAVRTQATDGNGGARFNDLPAAATTFAASKAGYGNGTASLTVVPNITTQGVIKLAGTPSIVIITVTTGSTPISGTTVKASPYGMPDVVQVTNSQGIATFSNLPAKQTVFTVNPPGYTPGSASLIVNSGVTVNQTITLAREYGNLMIAVALASAYTPIAGATVSVTVNGTVQKQVTDAQGHVTFTALPTGHYTFTAAMSGYQSGSVQADVFRGDNALGGKAIYLSKETGSINVTVTDGTVPVDLADVELLASNATTKSMKTNGQGIASFSGQLTGQYKVTAGKYGYNANSVMASITANATTNASVALTKQPGAFNARITVRDAFGTYLSGVTVTVQGNGVSQTQTTDTQGAANFSNLPIGAYTVTATKSGFKTFNFTTNLTSAGLAITLVTP